MQSGWGSADPSVGYVGKREGDVPCGLEKPRRAQKRSKREDAAGDFALEKIISGGQTGADRGGLEAAKVLGLKTGGTVPLGFKTEKGADLTLKDFGLTESHNTSYPFRTKKNVDDSDGTLAFRLHPGSGTDKTIGWCHSRRWQFGSRRGKSFDEGWRPVLVISSLSEEQFEENSSQLNKFIQRNKIRTLNVAGHRETTAGIEGFGNAVTSFLIRALSDRKE